MEDILKIGAAYIRVSDERQDEYSPDSQLKIVREHAARDGVTIPDEYVFYDDGISGRNVKKRNDFNRMIAMAKEKSHPFEIIYVWKFSRFARNQEQSILYKNLLLRHSVSVISVSEPIPDGPFGTLIERIIEWMDEFYSINLSAEVKRGMTEKVSRGEPICYPAIGYVIKDGNYYPDEETGAADIVREIFERYANGEGTRTICLDLGARNFRTRKGSVLTSVRIDYILHNPVYIGKIRWCPDGTKAVSNKQYDNENIMVVDGNHKPLISLDLWNKVQKRLAEMKAKYPKFARRDQPIEYLFKGMIKCHSCGGSLVLSSAVSGKNKTRTMQCCNYSRGSCKTSHSITVPRLTQTIIDSLETALSEKQFHIVPKKPDKGAPKPVNYDALIALEERRIERFREAYLNGIDTLEQYAAAKQKHTENIANLKAKRDATPVVTVNTEDFAIKVSNTLDFIKQTSSTDKAKNEVLRTIIEKIIYDKANENLAIYFHDF